MECVYTCDIVYIVIVVTVKTRCSSVYIYGYIITRRIKGVSVDLPIYINIL